MVSLHKNRPIQLESGASGVVDRACEKVKTGRMRNNDTGLSATGIPPHAVLANRMAHIEVEVDTPRGETRASFD